MSCADYPPRPPHPPTSPPGPPRPPEYPPPGPPIGPPIERQAQCGSFVTPSSTPVLPRVADRIDS